MAPSANRRSGHSRRAQYSTFFSYIAGLAGALVGAALLLVSIFSPSVFSGLRGLAAQAAEPGGGVAARTRSAGRSIGEVIEGYFLAGARNARMQRELREARVQLVEAKAIKAENARLKKLLDLSRREPRPVTTTRITSSTGASSRRFATIGAGSKDGIAAGMPVRSELGLVGRVLETGRASAQVLLITDTESLVPVRRAQDGVTGFAKGRGDGTLQIRLVNLGVNPIRKGDVFVSSGSGGLYRPGTPMATATRVTTDGAIARVLADPAATEYVLVDELWAPEMDRNAAPASKEATGAP